MADAADRSIPATPRRREAARREGGAPSAAIPAGVAVVATAVLLLPGWARTAIPAADAFLRASLRAACAGGTVGPVDPALLFPGPLLWPTAALVLGAAGAGLCVHVLFDGSAWRLSRAAPRWRRIDPIAGTARILSVATLRAVLWNVACLAVLGVAAACAVGPLVGLLHAPGPLVEPERALAATRSLLLPVVLAASAVAAARWGLARLAFERRIRMTPEEFKDEIRSAGVTTRDPAKVHPGDARRRTVARPPSVPDSRSDR